MHKTLTEFFKLSESGGSRCHKGKIGIHTAVPASETLYAVAGVEISYIVTLAGGTNESATSAAEAGLRKLCPFFRFKDFQLLFCEIF